MTLDSELIKNFTKKDYIEGKINLHIHTTYSDGAGEFSELTKQAQNMYTHFAITDHNTIQGHLDNPNSKSISGVEFDVWHKGIFLHLLGYGFDIRNEEMKKYYAKSKKDTEKDIVRIFSNRNLKELINSIHKAGGIAVLAHPCCCWTLNLDSFVKDLKNRGLDGIEVYYPYPRWRKYFKFSSIKQVEKIADKYGLIKTGGTDCHSKTLA